MTTLQLELEDELADKFNELAELEHIGTTQLIKNVLLEYLEDLNDVRLAEQAMVDLESGKSSTITLEEWERQLDAMDD
jgi:RHH-type transcriptional regulator, rel operon repressor / antitoxin RelB